VFLWATGYPAARFGTSDADPFTFLCVRFAIVALLLSLYVVLIMRPRQPDWNQIGHSLIIGVLMQGIYLGGVFFAVSRGMPAGIAALVVALQPFLTAIAAIFVLDERLSLKRTVFFLGALFGIFMVLFPDFDFARAIPGVTPLTLASALLSPLAISIGAVYQKRCVTSLNLWVATAAQFTGAAIIMGVMSLLFEDQTLVWTPATFWSLVWLVVVLSVGAVALLMYLIRQGNSSSVASLFFLVPIVSMFMTWLLFNETINLVQMIGSLIVVVCVALSSRYGEAAVPNKVPRA
jgi:drug/metabolite transporter (DMT)-like permease